jgi:nicotinate-nucleotide pyrophosphorylase (carboxylating)
MLMKPDSRAIELLVRAALLEDAPWGDLTSQTLLPSGLMLHVQLVAREAGVLCGEDIFTAAMTLTGPIETVFRVHDGELFAAGDVLADVSGPAQSVLQAERVALNFTQRLCGIATLTAQYVAETAGTKARIIDTRKTTPGLRLIERYAVRCGGGHNHRFSLSDAVLAKDNHLAALAQTTGNTLVDQLRSAFGSLPHTTHIEIEVDRLDQIESVIEAGADTVLLDNFTTDQMRKAVQQIDGRIIIEASGNMTLSRIREVASTGVDLISVGALTHSVRALDLGLDIAQRS